MGELSERQTVPARKVAFAQHWFIWLVSAIIVTGGLWLTLWYGAHTDKLMRNTILTYTRGIAQSVDPLLIKQLSFTAADGGHPAYQRLSRDLTLYGEQVRVGLQPSDAYVGIYSVARRGDQILFGPENSVENDPYATAPGTHYDKPPADLLKVFDQQQSIVIGPYADEYGAFVSGFAPVFDPTSGEVILVIGVDVEAPDWAARLNRTRLNSLSFVGGLLAIVLGGYALLGWRDRRVKRGQRGPRYLEAALVVLFIVALTAGIAFLSFTIETYTTQQLFTQVASFEAAQISSATHTLEASQLEGLARFIENSREVDPDEFANYTESLTSSTAVTVWGWAPLIIGQGRAALEISMSKLTGEEFRIWELDKQGQRRNAGQRDHYFPLLYLAPDAAYRAYVGFDLASNPSRARTMSNAQGTGLTTATQPLTLLSNTSGIVILRPVFAIDDSKALRGFAIAAIQPQ